MSALGNHILVEFTGCSPEIMNDVVSIERDMVEAAVKAEMTVINSTFHHFSPYGVSGVVVVQESHLAIHTWPEYGYAAVDIFTCGDTNTWAAFDYLQEQFKAKNYSAIEMRRGVINLLERMDFDLSSMRSQASDRVNPGKYTRNVWFTDKDDNQALSLRYTGEVLFRKESPYQRVSVLDTYAYGKMLTIDNMVMCTEKDEHHYHEMISHPALLTHPHPKNILVIGGGDGGTVREILKHNTVEKVTMVEIDETVIDACKEHLPSIAAEFNNPKLNLIVGDGIEYVKNAKEGEFDLIMVDGSDPVGPAEGLFSTTFYNNCKKALSNDGILVAQGESPMFNGRVFVELNQCLVEIFGQEKVNTLLFYIPTYPTGMWSFQVASKGDLSLQKADKNRIKEFADNNKLFYYNEDIHFAALSMPNFVKNLLAKEAVNA